MSNELLGAYNDISTFGQVMRQQMIPFWSWKEVNMKRYYRLMKNVANDAGVAHLVGRRVGSIAARSPFIAYRAGKFIVKAGAVMAGLQAYNHLLFPEEERELAEGIRRTPHIILGRADDGTIKYFNRLGALGDFLEWSGIDQPWFVWQDYFNGKITANEAIMNTLKAPLNIFIQGLRPDVKILMEQTSGKSLFPDIRQPRTIRDKFRQVWKEFGLENEYDIVNGMPNRGYKQILESLIMYSADPGQMAFMDVYDAKQRFWKKKGLSRDFSGFLDAKNNALYYFKVAVRYGDKEAAEKFLQEYVSYGGDAKGMDASVRAMHPLSGLSTAERPEFLNQLDEEEKGAYERSLKFYDEVLLPSSQDLINKFKVEDIRRKDRNRTRPIRKQRR
jgi:hypothetical protein